MIITRKLKKKNAYSNLLFHIASTHKWIYEAILQTHGTRLQIHTHTHTHACAHACTHTIDMLVNKEFHVKYHEHMNGTAVNHRLVTAMDTQE